MLVKRNLLLEQVGTQSRLLESAQRLEGQLLRQVQLPWYPKVGGLAGHTFTHRFVRLSAKDPPVHVATQTLLTVLASPKELVGHRRTQVFVLLSPKVPCSPTEAGQV